MLRVVKEVNTAKTVNGVKALKDKRAFISTDLFLGIFVVLLTVLVVSKFL